MLINNKSIVSIDISPDGEMIATVFIKKFYIFKFKNIKNIGIF